VKFKSFVPAVAIFILGIGVTIIGVLFKIQHWPYSSLITTIGTFIELLALFWALIIIVIYYTNKT